MLEEERRLRERMSDIEQRAIKAAQDEAAALNEQNQAIREETELIGKDVISIERIVQARLDAAIATKQQELAALRGRLHRASQLSAVLLTVAWSAAVAAVSYKIVDLVVGLRVSEEVETVGLDLVRVVAPKEAYDWNDGLASLNTKFEISNFKYQISNPQDAKSEPGNRKSAITRVRVRVSENPG